VRGNTYALRTPQAPPGTPESFRVFGSSGQELQPPLRIAVAAPGEPLFTEYRQVVLDDGAGRGNKTKTATSTSGQTGYMMRDTFD
jgi:hypothetical protein